MKTILAAYVPVLHRGYIDFFEKYTDTDGLAVFGPSIIASFSHLRKDIRKMEPEHVRDMVEALDIFTNVWVLDATILSKIQSQKWTVIMPDEDESHAVAELHFKGLSVTFEDLFLRWDRSKVLAEQSVTTETLVASGALVQTFGLCKAEAEKSSDWWRQVGALVVQDNRPILLAHNCHVPTARAPYTLGDPRSFFSRGIHIELSTAEHAEASIIAEAARRGISLEGAALYVTTFPCPMCARLIVHSGIKTCYFLEGYAMLDGEMVLRDADVTLVRVVLPTPSD